jgi:hypothetical protein
MMRVYKVGRNHRMEGDTCSRSDNGAFKENLGDKSDPLDQGHITKDWQKE